MRKTILLTIIIFSITILFSISCKPKKNNDLLSIEYAIKMRKNIPGKAKAEALNSKALILYKQKKFLEAAKEYLEALKLYTNAEIYFNFGDTLFNLSRFEEAGKAYVISAELGHKKRHLSYYNAACSYSRLKNKELGLKYLSLAIQHGYNALEYIKKDNDLAFLRSQVNIDEFIGRNRQVFFKLGEYWQLGPSWSAPGERYVFKKNYMFSRILGHIRTTIESGKYSIKENILTLNFNKKIVYDLVPPGGGTIIKFSSKMNTVRRFYYKILKYQDLPHNINVINKNSFFLKLMTAPNQTGDFIYYEYYRYVF